jgi:hypothetical protein
MRRIVPETQAAERRTWNSNPSEDTRVTNGEWFPLTAILLAVFDKLRKVQVKVAARWEFFSCEEKREKEKVHRNIKVAKDGEAANALSRTKLKREVKAAWDRF